MTPAEAVRYAINILQGLDPSLQDAQAALDELRQVEVRVQCWDPLVPLVPPVVDHTLMCVSQLGVRAHFEQWRALCRCGWRGEVCFSESQALVDHRIHEEWSSREQS
jgi:hypothetical protein